MKKKLPMMVVIGLLQANESKLSYRPESYPPYYRELEKKAKKRKRK